MARKPYPSDVTDDDWAFVAPYLTLMKDDAPWYPRLHVNTAIGWEQAVVFLRDLCRSFLAR